jgi:hypothetical protein
LSGYQFNSPALYSCDLRTRPGSIQKASALCGGTGVSPVQPGGVARLPTRQAWIYRRKSHILPEATRIESLTDTNATSNASTVQIAADPMPPWKIGGGTDGMDMESC